MPLSPSERVDRDRGSFGTGLEAAREERRALGWAAIAAAAAIAWIVTPVGVGILLGTLLAFAAQPLFERLKPRVGPRASAFTIVVASILVFAGTLSGLAWLLAARGTSLAQAWLASQGPRGPGAAALSAVGRLTGRFGVAPDDLSARARALAEAAAARAAGVAELLVATAASSLLALFLATLSMHFILRNWEAVALRAQETFPLRPDYTAGLFAEFRRVGRSTLLGTMGTGLAQGVLGTVGFWMTGVSEPLFFGAAVAVASLVPAIGGALVWVPVGLVMILDGHPTRGVIELVWGATIVGALCDYVVRPRLIGRAGAVPSLVTFAAILGGVQVFGLKGLIVGPVLMSVAIAVLRMYAVEAHKRRASLLAEPAG